MKRTTISERALLLAPRGRDAPLAASMLQEAGIDASACASLTDLVEELDRGAALAIITEEAVATADLNPLSQWLANQEEWSDFPIILLTSRGGGLERNPTATRQLDVLSNVTFLERPFHPTTLVSLARSALRARRRQYEARARLIALRDSEERYRTLFETMDEGFCIIEFLDGPPGPMSDYVHVQANPAYTANAGVPDILGKRLREVVSESEADAWAAIYRRVLVTGEAIQFERELVETKRHLELSAFRIEPESRRQVAVLFKDASDRKQAENELRVLNETLERRVEDAVSEREKAAAQLHEVQKLETLGQLTGGGAHDINNLLTPITGALDMLARRHVGNDERATRLIGGAQQSAERARILVSRLLGFARRQSLETRPVDLASLIDGMRDLIASSVGSTITIEVFAESDLLSAVADPNQLELALLNLCVNARDAMPDGGTVTIAARKAGSGLHDIPALPPGDYVVLSVIDTGTGMDEATLARAIEPFYSTKEIGKGTGLGLSMIHGLAAQLGGAFRLSSAVGAGTRAELYLPTTTETGKRDQNDNVDLVATLNPMTILLVDDEELVRAGTADMLRNMGHVVHEAAGGMEALDKLGGQTGIDLVITDYLMPGFNGAELAKRIHQQDSRLPVLVVTGYAGGNLDIGLPQLAKPFRQSDLAKALAELVGAAPSPLPATRV